MLVVSILFVGELNLQYLSLSFLNLSNQLYFSKLLVDRIHELSIPSLLSNY